MKKCVSCGCELPDEAMFCGDCGVSQLKEKFCVSCGKSLPVNALFCDECGASQQAGADVTRQADQSAH